MSTGERQTPGSFGNTLSAKRKALQLLERMDRSRRDLELRLKKSGYPEEEIQEAVRYAASFGYLDDRRYASSLIRRKLHTSSRQKIMQELYQKGIDSETALEAWEETAAEEGYDEEALAMRALNKRCPDGVPEDPAEKRKVYAYLARQGFSLETVRDVMG